MAIRFSGPLPPQNDRSIVFQSLLKSVNKFCTRIKSFCDSHKSFNSISCKRLTNVRTVSKNRTKNQSTKIDTFAKLGGCFGGNDEYKTEIQGKINSLIQSNDGKIDKKLFDTIQKTLKKDFNVSDADFYKAWSKAISTTQGGEELGGKIGLKIGGEDVELNLKFTPQVKMSGFIGDPELRHYSSAIQNYSLQKTGEKGNHAVNLWKQDIEVNGKNMQFLRHGCTRGGEEATKEILLNALLLQKGNAVSNWKEGDEPLELQFTNVQLMTVGHIADRKMPIEQINTFKALADQKSIDLKTKDGKTIKVILKNSLLFDFGVNLQHFKGIEKVLADSQDKEQIKEQNLASFKQLFGTNFPNIIRVFDATYFEEGSLIKKYLDDHEKGDADKAQIRTLANQILDIYKNYPEGLKGNPYALPTRVLALTNLLGYASSFNCKSGKDRTGVCAMELTNLCAQMMAGKEINNPMETISIEEQQNLQAIYKEGSSARDILKINTVFQENLNIQEYLNFDVVGKRFGVDWEKSFEENVKNLNA